MNNDLTLAIELHRRGLWEQAAGTYRQILAADPTVADAWHLLGVLAHQAGNRTQARQLIRRALELQPGEPAFLVNLAEVYRSDGDYSSATACSQLALSRQPDFAEALHQLGLALHGLGQTDAALNLLRRVVEIAPNFSAAHNSLGLVWRSLGDIARARDCFARAVELQPDLTAARTNLGLVLLDLGVPGAAFEHCAAAVEFEPTAAPLRCNLARALRALQRWTEAEDELRAALQLDAHLNAAYLQLAELLEATQRPREATACLERLAELQPRRIEAWDNLAQASERQEDFAAAARAWRRAVALAPGDAQRLVSLGWALQEGGLLPEAMEQYRSALQIDSRCGVALLNLAAACEERGEFAEAEDSLRKALRAQPDWPLPYARLATLLRGDLPDADRVAMESWLAAPQLEPCLRTRLLFALGQVFDARADFGQAAAYWNEANALATQQAPTDYRRYDPQRHERFVDGLIATFTPELFARLAGGGVKTRQPVYVCGLPRSGTTLVEQILASHSQVSAAGELRFVRQLFESLPGELGRHVAPLACIQGLQPCETVELAGRHLQRLQTLPGGGAPRIVDKMPDNYLYLGLLALLFPRATLIHCSRDLRDTAVSCWGTDFRSVRWASDPAYIAARFAAHGRIMDHWRRVLPIEIQEIDYAAVVRDTRGAGERLLAACGLPWEDGCLEFYSTRGTVRTASVRQVRQPIYQRSVGRWRNYESHLPALLTRLAEKPPNH